MGSLCACVNLMSKIYIKEWMDEFAVEDRLPVADKLKGSGGAKLNKSVRAREIFAPPPEQFLPPPPKGFSGGGARTFQGWANFILLLLLS